VGRGGSQQHRQWYNRPTRTGSVVKQLGEGDHLNRLKAEKLLLAEVDSDHWKTWVRPATFVSTAPPITLP
jgi:hypothetical protein